MTKKIGFLTTGSEQDSYVYIETSVGKSYALGADNLTDNLCLNSSSTPNVTPDESTANITISPETNGDIDLYPNGTGKTAILKGNLELTLGNLNVLAANINIPLTNNTGTAGAIYQNGSIFLHSYEGDTNGQSVFLGKSAGNTSNLGDNNVGIGIFNSQSLTLGNGNTSVGSLSLQQCTSGSLNTAIGYQSLYGVTSGNNNIGVGQQALVQGNGDRNIVIAPFQGAFNYSGTESNNIVIGGSSTNAQTGDNNVIRIGETGSGDYQQNKCYLAGTYGVTPAGSGIQTVVMDSDGQLGTTSSGGGGFTWNVVSTSPATINMVASNGYIVNNFDTVTFVLPVTSAVGEEFEITCAGQYSGGWTLTQNTGQTIYLGAIQTTNGTSGYLQSTSTGYGYSEGVRLVTVVADTDFRVVYAYGTITCI